MHRNRNLCVPRSAGKSKQVLIPIMASPRNQAQLIFWCTSHAARSALGEWLCRHLYFCAWVAASWGLRKWKGWCAVSKPLDHRTIFPSSSLSFTFSNQKTWLRGIGFGNKPERVVTWEERQGWAAVEGQNCFWGWLELSHRTSSFSLVFVLFGLFLFHLYFVSILFYLVTVCDPHLFVGTAKMKASKLMGWFAAKDWIRCLDRHLLESFFSA